MYHKQWCIGDIYTFKESINVKIIPKFMVLSQEICHAIPHPQEVMRKNTPYLYLFFKVLELLRPFITVIFLKGSLDLIDDFRRRNIEPY